jgi:hypothetical protein
LSLTSLDTYNYSEGGGCLLSRGRIAMGLIVVLWTLVPASLRGLPLKQGNVQGNIKSMLKIFT